MNNRRILISPLLSLTFLLVIVGVVWAQAPGPDRTTITSVWRRKHCSYRAHQGTYYCTLNLYYTPSHSCPSAGAAEPWFTASSCGWPFNCNVSAGCSISVLHPSPNPPEPCSPPSTGCTETTETTTLPEATVDGSFTCNLMGDNNWCVGGAGIDFIAHEPLPGETITTIEGTPGLLCDPPNLPDVSCSWSGGSEGGYSIGFWAMSSYGDSSEEGSVDWRLDTVPPTTGYSISGGTAGGGGWYRGGPLTVTASGSDATSGVPSDNAQVSIGGGAYAHTGTISSEGWYTLDLMATDRAGHSSTSSATVGLDNTPPVLNIGAIGTAGSGGWYTSATVTGTETGADALSGIVSRQYQIDGGTWQSGGSASITGEGAHTVNWQVTDIAGNTSTDLQTINIDSVPPTTNYNISGGTASSGGWYRGGPLTITASGSDSTSGIASTEVAIGGGAFVPSGTISVDGWYTLDLMSIDNAGHTSTGSVEVGLDSTPPMLNIGATGTAGSGGWYTSATVTGTETGTDALSGIVSRQYQIDGGTWQSGGSASVTGEGSHIVNWQVTDIAGNTSTSSQTINIDSVEPTSIFVTPAEGSTVTLKGVLDMNGTSADVTSGLISAQISLNGGGSWIDLTLTSGTWSYSWDTRTVPNGVYTVLVRAMDSAGNIETTAQITVIVDNDGPRVDIPASWMIWETAKVSVQDSGTGVSHARLVIHGGDYGNRRIDWYSGNIPNRFTWDRRFGEILAPPGKYEVTLVAWDKLGNSGSDSGVIVIPEPSTATPELIPTATVEAVSRTAKSGPKSTETPAQVAMAIELEEPLSAEPEIVEIPIPPAPYIWWPLAVVVGLAVILGVTGLYDPRPKAWRRLGEIRNEAFLAEVEREKKEDYN